MRSRAHTRSKGTRVSAFLLPMFALTFLLIPVALIQSSEPGRPELSESSDSVLHFERSPFPELRAAPDPVPPDSQWWDGFRRPGVSDNVKALAIHNGDLIAGGGFGVAGRVRANGIASWDGEAWSALGSGMSDIEVLASYGEDIIAGRTGYCGTTIIEHWDGSVWEPLGGGLRTHDYMGCSESGEIQRVYALAEYGGYLYVGGYFFDWPHAPEPTPDYRNLIRWDGEAWGYLGDNTTNGDIRALAVYDGKLVAGGAFTTAGGATRFRIAFWDGSVWSSLGEGINNDLGSVRWDKFVKALAVHEGELYAGGVFDRADSSEVEGLACWDGVSWKSTGFVMGSGFGSGSLSVNALATYGGKLIAGGKFKEAAGAVGNFIASYDGESWAPLGPGLNGVVNSLKVSEGLLVAGGEFYASGSNILYHIAIWDGSTWHPMGDGEGMQDVVTALAVHDGYLVAGGWFEFAGEVLANSVARWNGNTWDSLAGRWNLAGEGVRMFTLLDGDLLAVGDKERRVVKRWDGSAWLNYTSEFSSNIRAITVYEGSLVAAGKEVALWDDASWVALCGRVEANRPEGAIEALEVIDGSLVAAGFFYEIGGITVENIARWDGSVWSPIGDGLTGSWTREVVYDLGVFEGELIAGGAFNRSGTTELKNMARWDGEAWLPLGRGIAGVGSPPTLAMTVYNGTLIAAGPFEWADSFRVWNMARWNGASWSPIGSGFGDDGFWYISAIALEVFEGSLYVGGKFNRAGERTSHCIARWKDAFPGMVMHFDALPSGSSVNLRWTSPDTAEYAGTLIRYSATEHPQNPTDGLPVLNGNDGRFDGEQGSEGSFAHEGEAGATYYYAAFAYDNSFTHSTPAFASATAWDSVPPGPLSYFEAAEDTCKVRLAWTTPPDEDLAGVLVRFSNSGYPSSPEDGIPVPNGNDGRFESLPDSVMVFVHETLDCDTTYYYSAWAYDPGNNYSTVSRVAARSQDPPDAVPVAVFSAHEIAQGIRLEWTNPSSSQFASALIRFSPLGYPLHRLDGDAVPNGNDGVFEGAPGSDSAFVHSGLGSGITYYYSAWARYEGGAHSVPKTLSIARTDTGGISPPSTFEATALLDEIRLDWTNPEDESFSHVLIRYSTDAYPGEPGDGLALPNGNDGIFEGAPGSDSSFIHGDLPSSNLIYYSAWAFDEAGNYSSAVNAVGDGPIDALPLFHAIPNDERVYLIWTVSLSGGVDYVVIRYSTEGFPLTPEEGFGVPNDNDGWFIAWPPAWGYFLHENLENGVTYYYSAFVHSSGTSRFSAPVMCSALPGAAPGRDPLQAFTATSQDQSVHLAWTLPVDETVDSLVIRYSTGTFPDGPEDGEALPNGDDGWFAAVSGGYGEFTHEGLVNGQAYYYGGFVHFRDPSRFSFAATCRSTPQEIPDEEPPGLSVSVMQNPYLTRYLDLYMVSSEELLPESVRVHVGGEEVSMELIDADQHVWKGDYALDGPAASVAIVACGCDSALNRACETMSFAAGYLTRIVGGEVSSPEGRVRLLARPGGIVRDAYVVIAPQDGPAGGNRQLSAYRLSPEDILTDRGATLEFSYANLGLEAGLSPDRLYIEQQESEPLACYVDPDRQSIVTTVRSLGTFRLAVGAAGASSTLDPDFLRVEAPRPNPFTNETRIRFEVRARQTVRAVVYDTQGRVIRELMDDFVDPGLLDLTWNGRGDENEVPSGIYFLKISTGRRTASCKILLLK